MADNSRKYSTRGFARKAQYDLQNPDKEQTAVVFDLLAEGPIEGLVNGESSVYYNDVPLFDSANRNIMKPRKFTATATASSTSLTASEFGVIRTLSYNNRAGLNIGDRMVIIAGAGTKGTGIASISAGSAIVTTSSGYFANDVVAMLKQPMPVYIRIVGAGPGGADLVTSIKKKLSDTKAELTTRAYTTVSNADIVQDHVSKINSISGNVATLKVAPSTTVTNAICLVSGPQLGRNDQIANFSHVAFSMTKGTIDQPALQVRGFTGSSSTVYDANIQIRQADLANVSGLSGLGTNYNGTTGGVKAGIDEPGNSGQGSASDTVLTAAVMGVSNPSEVDEVHLTFSFPEMHAFKNSGAKGPSFVEFQMFFEFTQDGSNFISALAFGPSNAAILSRGTTAPWGNGVTYGVRSGVPSSGYVKPKEGQYSEFIEEFVMNVEQFQPFQNYRIRIRRITDEDFKDNSFQHKNASFLKTVENITKDRLRYPYSAVAANVFNAKDFSGGLPSRAYKLKGKLIQVPTNYLTRDESSDGTAKYTRSVTGSSHANYAVVENAAYQNWDGSFRGDKTAWSEGHPNRDLVYSNNPAWVFYDLLTNNRYGMGDFVDTSLIDKYSLFEIAKYCDDLVSDGEGGLEPRFTANLYFDKTAEATKVLRDIASIFRGMVLWMDGEIVAIADRPKEPVYTFTKGNVEGGVFQYEGTGDRVRTNQVKVTWNDPNDNYRQATEYVEDHQNILETNRLVREASVAMGCTSRAQAHRYGKWKLLSAQLEKETVTFSTGINAAGIRPGDIIAVQDADKDGFQYSGRVSNTGTRNTTTIPLDRTLTLPAYSTSFRPQLLLIYPSGGAYLVQEQATINSTTYYQGDLLLENADGSALDTQEEAANLKDDNNNSVQTYWSENVRVEKQSVTTSAGDVTSLTVASAFSATPDAEVIWALQLFNTDGTLRTGTAKEYKVVSVTEDKEGNKLQIVGSEYAREKFGQVDRGYDLYSAPIETVPDRDDIIPAPANIVAKVESMSPESPDLGETVDADVSGSRVVISWRTPLNSTGEPFKHVQGFELKHSFNGGLETIKLNPNDKQFIFNNVKLGEYEIHIRTLSTTSTFSAWTVRRVTVSARELPSQTGFRLSEIKLGGQLNQTLSLVSGSTLTIAGSGTYDFIGANGISYNFVGTGTGNFQQTVDNMSTNSEAFLVFDADDTSDHLKLIEEKEDQFDNAPYWAEVGASGAGFSDVTGDDGATQTKGSISQFSNEVTLNTATTSLKSGNLVRFVNSTTAFKARIQHVDSSTRLLLDAIAPTSFTTSDGFKQQSFKPDILNDSIIAKVTLGGAGNAPELAQIFAVTSGAAGGTGTDGKQRVVSYVYFQTSSANAPSTPSATSYNISNNSFSGLTSGWSTTPPTFAAGNDNKYWYSYFTAVENTAGGGTSSGSNLTFQASQQGIGFSGLVTFTSGNVNISDGTTQYNPAAVIQAGTTTIDGDKITTGTITADQIAAGAISLTGNRITGTLPASSGGTGLTSITTLTNSQISISSSGVLSGAGGGQVTASGLGANTDSTASIRAGTSLSNISGTTLSAGKIKLTSSTLSLDTSSSISSSSILLEANSSNGARIIIAD